MKFSVFTHSKCIVIIWIIQLMKAIWLDTTIIHVALWIIIDSEVCPYRVIRLLLLQYYMLQSTVQGNLNWISDHLTFGEIYPLLCNLMGKLSLIFFFMLAAPIKCNIRPIYRASHTISPVLEIHMLELFIGWVKKIAKFVL